MIYWKRSGKPHNQQRKDGLRSHLIPNPLAKADMENMKATNALGFFVRVPGRGQGEKPQIHTAEVLLKRDPGEREPTKPVTFNCWRKNGIFSRSVENDRWREVGKKRRHSNLEKQDSQGEITKLKNGNIQPPSIRGSNQSDGKADPESARNEHNTKNTEKKGETFKSSVCDKEKTRGMETNYRLQSVEQCNEVNPFQTGGLQVTRTNYNKRRLCNNFRPKPGLLFSESGRQLQAVSCVRIQRKLLLFQRNAIWIQRFSKNLYKNHEEGDTIHPGAMERKSNRVPRRYYSSSPRPKEIKMDNSESRFSFRKPWSSGKHRKESFDSLTNFHLFGFRVEHAPVQCSSGNDENERTYKGMYQMEEEVPQSERSESKRPCSVHWKAERYKVRGSRSFSVSLRSLSHFKQNGFDGRMEREDEDQPVHSPQSNQMDIEVENQHAKTTMPTLSSRCNTYDGCFQKSCWSLFKNRKQYFGFSSQTPLLATKSKFKLSGDVRNFVSSNSLLPNSVIQSHPQTTYQIGQLNIGVQPEQVAGRSEFEKTPIEDLETNAHDADSSESATHPRSKKRKGRFSFQARKGRRLSDKARILQGACNEDEIEHNVGRFRHKTKQESEQMVRARKPDKRRRSAAALARRDSSCSSSNSSHSSDNQENDSRTSSRSSPSSRLEGTNMGAVVEKNDPYRMDVEEPERTSYPGTMDEEDGCLPATREASSCTDESLAINGEHWFKGVLQTRGFPMDICDLCKSSLSPSTWHGYLLSYAHFGDQWTNCGYGLSVGDWFNWVVRCADVFLKLFNKGLKEQSLCKIRSAISLISQLLFERSLGDYPLMKLLFRSFKRLERRKKKNKPDIWNPKILLDYISGLGENANLSFTTLTKKTICLCMLFSACRFTELERISLKHSAVREDSIALDTSLKTGPERTDIIIPFLTDTPSICPASAVCELWSRISKLQDNPDHLFINDRTKIPLSARVLRKLVANLLHETGIPNYFGPYSIKHASISALTMAGLPIAQVAKFARLSPRSDTIINYYFQKDIATSCAKVIADQAAINATSSQTQSSPLSLQTLRKPKITFDDNSSSEDIEDSSSTDEEQDEEDYSLNSKSDNIESEKGIRIRLEKPNLQYDNKSQTIYNDEEEPSKPDYVEEPDENSHKEYERRNFREKRLVGEVVQKKTIEITIKTRAQAKREQLEQLLRDDK